MKKRKLSREVIKDFKRISKEECGRELSDEEAEEAGLRLLRVIKMLYVDGVGWEYVDAPPSDAEESEREWDEDL